MAKRLTDANKWDDPWYQDLSANYKLAWDYITSKCDSVGVWKPSEKSMNFHISLPVNLDSFLKICGPERIFVMPNGNWWLVKFCDFQYGELKEDSKSQTSISYIKHLKKHGLWEPYMKGTYRVCNTPKDKYKDKEEEEYKEEESSFLAPNDFEENFLSAFDSITCERYKTVYGHLNLEEELKAFRIKCDNDPATYHVRDSPGLRTAFQYQLQHSKNKTNGTGTRKDKASEINGRRASFAQRHGSGT